LVISFVKWIHNQIILFYWKTKSIASWV